ncbi:Pc20g11390 [Penicillium rubens Wisconsin 54-1255]|uniref:Pc20g11390 protein n=1 Tax=Penicillium rubens (strain ATCC 28089 / DSM 1075 / NRRL 1951 / Wisconsin 54-1255) TaxID=500485 RepID=B6HG73_PENRW|nr:Pc20g11390 [Penicillium rubens Wisconsin 54-1255]
MRDPTPFSGRPGENVRHYVKQCKYAWIAIDQFPFEKKVVNKFDMWMQACSQKQGNRSFEEYAESVRLLSSQVGPENQSELAQAWVADYATPPRTESEKVAAALTDLTEMMKGALITPGRTGPSTKPRFEKPSQMGRAPGQIQVPQQRGPTKPLETMVCWRCGQSGHIATACANSPLPRRNRINIIGAPKGKLQNVPLKGITAEAHVALWKARPITANGLVIYNTSWPQKQTDSYESILIREVKVRDAGHEFVTYATLADANIVIILDEAQMSYGDDGLWLGLIKSQSATRLHHSVNHPILPKIALFYNREEFDDVISRYYQDDRSLLKLDDGASEYLFNLTNGHPGAVDGVLNMLQKPTSLPVDEDALRRLLAQPVQYMQDLGCAYGVYTTYGETIFLRQVLANGMWEIQYSPCARAEYCYQEMDESIDHINCVRQTVFSLGHRITMKLVHIP